MAQSQMMVNFLAIFRKELRSYFFLRLSILSRLFFCCSVVITSIPT
jgi:hypothetical protein